MVLFCGTDADVVIELKPVWAWFFIGRSRVKFDELDTPEDAELWPTAAVSAPIAKLSLKRN